MIQIRSICLSAHLDSFCRKLDELAGVEFVYQTDDPGAMRRRVGWSVGADYNNGPMTDDALKRAKACDLLVEMLREVELMEERAKAGLKTVYVSERWLKPLVVHHLRLPAIMRIFLPGYRRMVKRFVRLMDDENFWVFPCGVHAARDFARIYGLIHGDIRCFFKAPKIDIQRSLGGDIKEFPRMKLWGYFVDKAKSNGGRHKSTKDKSLKVLWFGRMLDWKRVDVLIKAFIRAKKSRSLSLLLVGEGPENNRLRKLAGNAKIDKLGWEEGKIVFHGYVPNGKIRELLREADVYVMPSNAEEGWGAAVSEALLEGCPVISTYEAGSSATLLPEECLYHANNIKALADKLLSYNGGSVPDISYTWSGDRAAETLLEIVK